MPSPAAGDPLPSVLVDWESVKLAGDGLARQAGVEVDWSLLASEAPVHIRQIVEITRLLSRGASTIILDEPTSILAPRQVEDLFEMLRALRQGGATILFISHKLKEVLALADIVTVMRKGRVIATKRVADTNVAQLTELMVGESVAVNTRVASCREGGTDPVLRVRGLQARDDRGIGKLRDVDLDLWSGEIHGIAGISRKRAGRACRMPGRIASAGRRFGEAGRDGIGRRRQPENAGIGNRLCQPRPRP